MKNTYKIAVAAVLFSLSQGVANHAMAQTEWGEGKKMDLGQTEYVVEKNRVIELPEASRNYEKFRIDPPEVKTDAINYRFTDYRMPAQDVNVAMKVLTIKPEELSKLYGNYVKFGFGNYSTPYFKGYFHNKRSKDYALGAEVSHVSSANGPVDGSNSGVSNSALNLHGETYRGGLTAGARVGYGRDKYHFYGYSPQLENVNADTIEQVFNRVNADVYFNNGQMTNTKLKYDGGLGFTYLNDKFSAKEANIAAKLNTAYYLDKATRINVGTDFSYVSYKDSTDQGRPFFKIRPTYERDTDQLDFAIGVNIAYSGDTLNDARKFNIYPVLRASYEAIEEKLVIFGGLEGDLQRVTLYSLTQENPFLAPNLKIADTNKGLDVYGGIQANLSRDLQFTGRLAYQNYRNLYFFNFDRPTRFDSLGRGSVDTTKFVVVYDEAVSSTINFFGQLVYNQSERLKLGVKAEYNNWSTDTLSHPYHRPALTASVFGAYNLHNKIFFNSELYYISSTFARLYRPDGSNVLRKSDTIVDLNLKVDYRFSDKFSTFVMVNNILSNKYERYVNYKNKGLNAIVGLSYSF